MSRHDVIVIGGGFAGLSAATTLAGADVDVLLLEARDRVGGRVESQVLADGLRIDSGGQFLCEDMPEVMALARKHGKTFMRPYLRGDTTFQPPVPPKQGYAVAEEVYELLDQIDATDLDDPDLAKLTVAEWLQQTEASPAAKAGFTALINGLWCRSPEEITFFYFASANRRVTNDVSELQFFLGETMHSLTEDMSAALGDRVRLNAAVTRVTHSADSVAISCGDQVFEAEHVVIAVPPVMARRLTFEPSLPATLTGALAAWQSGGVMKALLRYERPFWRTRRLNGTVMWRQPQGLYACDVGRGGDDAALVVFIGGTMAFEKHGQSRQELEAFIIGKLSDALGEEAGRPTEVNLRDWVDDSWSGGAYSDVITDIEARDAEAILRAGLPRISFASSEIALSFPGYIEGAIAAGQRAAGEILSSRGKV